MVACRPYKRNVQSAVASEAFRTMIADLYINDPAEPSAICGNTWNVPCASTDGTIATENKTPRTHFHMSDESNCFVIGTSPKVLRAIRLPGLVFPTAHRGGPARQHFPVQ